MQFNLEHELALASSPQALVDHLDLVLTYGTMTQQTRQAILAAIEPEDVPRERVLMAIYLVMASPDYAVAL